MLPPTPSLMLSLITEERTGSQPLASIGERGADWASQTRPEDSAWPRGSSSSGSRAWHLHRHWKCWDDCSDKTRPRSRWCRLTGTAIASFIRRALNRQCSRNLQPKLTTHLKRLGWVRREALSLPQNRRSVVGCWSHT